MTFQEGSILRKAYSKDQGSKISVRDSSTNELLLAETTIKVIKFQFDFNKHKETSKTGVLVFECPINTFVFAHPFRIIIVAPNEIGENLQMTIEDCQFKINTLDCSPEKIHFIFRETTGWQYPKRNIDILSLDV
jgi:hypothetical protein